MTNPDPALGGNGQGALGGNGQGIGSTARPPTVAEARASALKALSGVKTVLQKSRPQDKLFRSNVEEAKRQRNEAKGNPIAATYAYAPQRAPPRACDEAASRPALRAGFEAAQSKVEEAPQVYWAGAVNAPASPFLNADWDRLVSGLDLPEMLGILGAVQRQLALTVQASGAQPWGTQPQMPEAQLLVIAAGGQAAGSSVEMLQALQPGGWQQWAAPQQQLAGAQWGAIGSVSGNESDSAGSTALWGAEGGSETSQGTSPRTCVAAAAGLPGRVEGTLSAGADSPLTGEVAAALLWRQQGPWGARRGPLPGDSLSRTVSAAEARLVIQRPGPLCSSDWA